MSTKTLILKEASFSLIEVIHTAPLWWFWFQWQNQSYLSTHSGSVASSVWVLALALISLLLETDQTEPNLEVVLERTDRRTRARFGSVSSQKKRRARARTLTKLATEPECKLTQLCHQNQNQNLNRGAECRTSNNFISDCL